MKDLSSKSDSTNECEICLKSFAHKATLQKHIEQIHEGKRPYECKVCQKRFSQKINLQTHTVSVHERKRSYQCNICSKTIQESTT